MDGQFLAVAKKTHTSTRVKSPVQEHTPKIKSYTVSLQPSVLATQYAV